MKKLLSIFLMLVSIQAVCGKWSNNECRPSKTQQIYEVPPLALSIRHSQFHSIAGTTISGEDFECASNRVKKIIYTTYDDLRAKVQALNACIFNSVKDLRIQGISNENPLVLTDHLWSKIEEFEGLERFTLYNASLPSQLPPLLSPLAHVNLEAINCAHTNYLGTFLASPYIEELRLCEIKVGGGPIGSVALLGFLVPQLDRLNNITYLSLADNALECENPASQQLWSALFGKLVRTEKTTLCLSANPLDSWILESLRHFVRLSQIRSEGQKVISLNLGDLDFALQSKQAFQAFCAENRVDLNI